MSDTTDNVPLEFENYDELVSVPPQHPQDPPQQPPPVQPPIIHPRIINVILDPSAFTRGIGNIKRWYNEEYVRSKASAIASQHTIVNLYIPSYTLHEFDYLKKGTSMIATYTRQSIKFIDDKFERNETTQNILPNFQVNLLIEDPSERGPRWDKCQRFQTYSPRVRDFPYFKTKFDSTFLGKKYEDASELPNDVRNHAIDDSSNDIQYENSKSYMNAAAHSDNFASMPARLKYLISSCIFKKYTQPHDFQDILEEWRLVSEEPITQIWARSYGIEAMNINEAELLIFQSFDVNRLYNPHTSFTLDDDIKHNSVLQDTVDTSLYSYKKLGTPTNRNRKKQMPIDGVTSETVSVINGERIKKERFDSINYAPRSTTGQLWKPETK